LASHPGKDEDYEGEAYVGAIGRKVRDFYNAQNPPRGLTWMDNLVACHPPEYRQPKPDEIAACKPRIIELVNILDPDLILAMGKEAVTALTGKRDTIDALRGKFHRAVIPGRFEEFEVPVFATYHPGQFQHNPSPGPKGMEALWAQDFAKAIKIAITLSEIREKTV